MLSENEKSEIIIPTWLLFSVLGIWLIAIPLVIFVFSDKVSLIKPEVLGINQETPIVETSQKDGETIPIIMGNNESAEELVVGVPMYTVSMCHNDFCQYLSNDDFKTFLVGKNLDKEKFNIFLHSHIIPFFEKKYGQRTVVKNSKGEFSAKLEDEEIVYSNVYDKINSAFISGINNIKVDLDYKISPSTDGKYAEKYIEVDNS